MTTLMVFNKGSGHRREASNDARCAALPVAQPQAAPHGPTEAEVRVEVAKHPGVVAYYDAETRDVKAFLLPTPPTVPARALSPLERMGQPKT